MPSRAKRGGGRPRRLALDICLAVLDQGESLSRLLEQRLGRLDDPRDRAFCSELCFGFCRYYCVLESTLNGLLRKPFRKKDRDVMVLLLLGLYQLRFMRVGDHAAVNETVGLLDAMRKGWAKGLANAVMRGYLRASPSDQAQALSDEEQRAAYPDWMRQRIEQDWPAQSAAIMAAGNEHAPMVLRVDSRQLQRDDYLQRLAGLEIPARAHATVESAVVLERACAVDRLPGFGQGLVSVQDAAAQLAAGLLDCQAGMRVLDACAAPGGKTLHLLQEVEALELVALDKDAQRLQRVADNLARAGRSASLVAADAAQVGSWYDGREFDRILLDAPCTNTGVLRRRPDARWRFGMSALKDATGLQRQMLELQHLQLQLLWLRLLQLQLSGSSCCSSSCCIYLCCSSICCSYSCYDSSCYSFSCCSSGY